MYFDAADAFFTGDYSQCGAGTGQILTEHSWISRKILTEAAHQMPRNRGAVTANKITKDDTYQKYMNKYAEAARPKQEIVVDASTYKTLNEDFTPSNETLSVQEFAGIKAVVLPDSGIVAWEVTVPETGLYNMKVQYYNFIEATYDKGDSRGRL